jgi:alpha-beta hydrolase superfamily lysophospholipase
VASDAKEFVVVDGAAHGAWRWEELTPRLVSRGHRVVTLDLPGHGRRAAQASRASVAAYAHAVADAMAREGVSILDRIWPKMAVDLERAVAERRQGEA